MERLDSLKSWLHTEIASEWDYDYSRLINRHPARLYHYTTIDGLMGIVTKNALFASNALFLNDSSELHYGKQLIKEALEQTIMSNEFKTLWYQGFGTKEIEVVDKVLNQIHTAVIGDIYVSCFTTQSDILSQWRGYANNSGIRIGFKRDDFISIFENVDLAEVDYNKKSQLKHIEQTVAILLEYVCLKEGKDLPAKDIQILPKAIASILLSSVCRFKNDVFKEEKEYRMIYDAVYHKGILPIHFRNNGKIIVPYVKLTAVDNQKLPITDIMVGQSPYSEKMKSGIELLLIANGYKNVKVSISKIPYIP